MDSFLRLMESNGVSVSASHSALLSKAYSDGISEHLNRSIDELPLVWRASNLSSNTTVAKRVLLGLLELVHCSRLAQQLEALHGIQGSLSFDDSISQAAGANQLQSQEEEEWLLPHDQDEGAQVDRQYREALDGFADQVRSLNSRLLLQGGAPPSLLCARPVDSLTAAEAALDRSLIGLADRLFASDDADENPAEDEADGDNELSDSKASVASAELHRIRDLHRRVLVERGRLAGRAAVLADQCRRLRAHLDDPERTLSMAKTWLAEAKLSAEKMKSSSEDHRAADAPDSTTLESAAAAVASVVASQLEQRRLDHRLGTLRHLADRQSRLLDLLQRRRLLHENLLSGQEAELAKLRRLRSLLESGRRQLAELDSTSCSSACLSESSSSSTAVIQLCDSADKHRLTNYLDRLSRVRARLEMNESNPGLTSVAKTSPEDLLNSTGRVLTIANDLLTDWQSASSVTSATYSSSASKQRLSQLNSRLMQVKQLWAASHSGGGSQ